MCSKDKEINGIILPPVNLNGFEQMALDVLLLDKQLIYKDYSMAIRFYTWPGCWISLGKNQKSIPISCKDLIKNKELKVVRRPSGGKAVLHSRGLTYSMVWISAPKTKREAYRLSSQWLINAFDRLGIHLVFGDSAPNRLEENCFATSTSSDLVDNKGNKLIGSAQLWRRGNLLQHGEIILDPKKKVWEKVFKVSSPSPAPKAIPREGLSNILLDEFLSSWPNIKWKNISLRSEDLINIRKQSNIYKVNQV
tara:strand:- start:141 stop:893 length:753 start_codon:yes stop_codon:yes gene_type:complete